VPRARARWRRVGDYVRIGEDVLLQNVSHGGLYAHASAVPLPTAAASRGATHEVNMGVSSDATKWRVHLYSDGERRAAGAGGDGAGEPEGGGAGARDIGGGDVIQISHFGHDAVLVVDKERFEGRAPPFMVSLAHAEANSNTLWEVELLDPRSGEALSWEAACRLRHVNSGAPPRAARRRGGCGCGGGGCVGLWWGVFPRR
jgi:hypothetical protein